MKHKNHKTMNITHSEKSVLLESLKQLSIGTYNPGKIGKEVDRKNLIKRIEKMKSEDPET